MEQNVQKVVLVPRYTTFAGARTFLTAAINVRKFASAELMVWRGLESGNLTAFSVLLQESSDLEHWANVGAGIAPSANTEATESRDLDLDWARLAISLTTPGPVSPAVTAWVVGNFVRRGE